LVETSVIALAARVLRDVAHRIVALGRRVRLVVFRGGVVAAFPARFTASGFDWSWGSGFLG